jgi:hypothetical protein
MKTEESKLNEQTEQLDIPVVMWRCLSDEYPEAYRNIKIEVDGEIIETRTYLHQHKLMIELRDGNEWFQGVSPKLFEQSTKWCYNAT